MIATRFGSAIPFWIAHWTASVRSSCMVWPHCLSPACRNFFPNPVEARKLGWSTA